MSESEVGDSDHRGYEMGQILRRILEEHGPLTYDELEQKIDEEVGAGIRYLKFIGEWEKDDRLVKYNTREYSIRSTDTDTHHDE